MASFFSKIRNKLMGSQEADYDVPEEQDEGYVELSSEGEGGQSKVTVRQFILEDFADVKPVLDSLRDGYTVALVNIKPLKDRDLVELKRAVNKIKKTCDAVEGDIAGFGDDWICVTPSFAEIYRDARASAAPAAKKDATGMEDEF